MSHKLASPRPCATCKRAFTPRLDRVHEGRGLFCSRVCYQQSRPQPVDERFWEAVDTSGGINACWRRRGPLASNGYGKFSIGRQTVGAHRFAFISVLGEPPPHLPYVLHKCRGGSNRWCVNPSHLAPGDAWENAQDCAREDRKLRGDEHPARSHPGYLARGEQHHHARFTSAEIRAIRQALANGALQRVVAVEYGTTQPVISTIKRGKTWRHVT